MSTSSTSDHVSQFYYSSSVAHLAQGQANNVCSNTNNTLPLPYSATVLVYAKDHSTGKFMGQVGLVTGVSDKKPSEVWPDWEKDTTVYDVVWVTNLQVIPSELMTNQSRSLPVTDCQVVVQFLLHRGG